jgi:hypothetical protein
MKPEDFIRLEYKVDLIIQALQASKLMFTDLPDLRGIEGDLCPVCSGAIRLSLDVNTETVARSCGCSLPITTVKGISTLLENTNASKRTEKSSISSEPTETGNSVS